jgi:hypothetical protein
MLATTALADSFAKTLQADTDCFAPVLVRARMLRSILSQHDTCDVVPALRAHIIRLQNELNTALLEVNRGLLDYRYGLIGRGLISPFYLLPIRVTQLLGWIGFCLYADALKGADGPTVEILRAIAQRLLWHYGNSIVAISEDQAAPLLLFLTHCARLSWRDEGEELVGRLYSDFNKHYGRVLINAPKVDDVLNYFLLRLKNPHEASEGYLQTPTDMFSVILIGAAMFDLDDAIDPTLIQLDHASFAFYVPDSYKDFWQDDIVEGDTFILQLGDELQPGHGVWAVRDMSRIWRHIIQSRVAEAADDVLPELLLAAAACSLLQPDRLPWCAVPPLQARLTTIRPL